MTKRNPPVQVIGHITRVTREGTSRNGNPTYRVAIRVADAVCDGSFLTQTDGSIGYAADNYRPDSREDGTRQNILHVNGRGRIVNITGPDRHTALYGER